MSLFGQLKDAVTAPISRGQKVSLFASQPKYSSSEGEMPLKGGPVKEFPFRYSVGLSFLLHVIGPVLLWSLMIVLLLLPLFQAQREEPRAMEFVLVPRSDEQAPENAKFLGEHNQLAGGKQENKPIPFEMESSTSAKSQPSQASAAQPSPSPSSQPSPMARPKPQPSPPKPKVRPPQPVANKPAISTPKPPEPKRESLVKPAKSTRVEGPIATSESSPMSQAGSGPANPSSQASQALASAGLPGLVPNMNRGAAEGGPAHKEGVSVKSVEFGPYMAELKRRLSRNWRPPRGEETRRVVLKFEIARDGTLKSLEVDESSGEAVADQAAMNAVEVSAPFRPLPPAFSGSSVPILFTFDYTVYGASRN